MSRSLLALAAFLLAGSAAVAAEQGAPPAALQGRWSAQSTVTKLVRVPVMESKSAFTRSAGSGWAMGGAGSSGSRVIHTMKDKEMPMSVVIGTTLGIRPDGRFTMIGTQERAASPTNQSCRVSTVQEKTGRVRVEGDAMTFTIEDAVERKENSCDASSASSTPMAGGTETYRFTVSGGSLRLNTGGGTLVLAKR